MSEESHIIWKENLKINADRHRKMKELMEEYDKTVFFPSRKAMQKKCEETVGHTKGEWQIHQFSSSLSCSLCGKILEMVDIENKPFTFDS
jgi:hypothetical protein